MKRIGTISYNIYCNFTNYGSALQTWALHQAIKKVAENTVEPVLVDYCPEILADKDPLNPFANMWDKDDESRRILTRCVKMKTFQALCVEAIRSFARMSSELMMATMQIMSA